MPGTEATLYFHNKTVTVSIFGSIIFFKVVSSCAAIDEDTIELIPLCAEIKLPKLKMMLVYFKMSLLSKRQSETFPELVSDLP